MSNTAGIVALRRFHQAGPSLSETSWLKIQSFYEKRGYNDLAKWAIVGDTSRVSLGDQQKAFRNLWAKKSSWDGEYPSPGMVLSEIGNVAGSINYGQVVAGGISDAASEAADTVMAGGKILFFALLAVGAAIVYSRYRG